MKVGIIGSGAVGQTLAAGFIKHGHEVRIGTREAAKLKDWAARNPGVKVASSADAAKFGDIVVLAVAGEAAETALKQAGAGAIEGKTVIDACNPIGGGPPVNGVLSFFTPQNESLMKRLQKAYPSAHFVKAFNSVGNGQMVNPHFAAGRPTMFISAAMTRTPRKPWRKFSISSAGRRRTWARPRRRAPSNPYASSGAFPVLERTTGRRTPLSCCGRRVQGALAERAGQVSGPPYQARGQKLSVAAPLRISSCMALAPTIFTPSMKSSCA